MSDFRTIPLTRGYEAVVDAADYGELSLWKWHANPAHSGAFYARRSDRSSGVLVKIVMHRFLLNAGPGDVVDHINRDTLDNRRSNLRICTALENHRNCGPRGGGFKGVHWSKQRGGWRATIRGEGKRHYLGVFGCPVAAAKAYDDAARRLHGAFAYFNFPEAV